MTFQFSRKLSDCVIRSRGRPGLAAEIEGWIKVHTSKSRFVQTDHKRRLQLFPDLLKGRSQTTLTSFCFFLPPTPLRLHFLPYKSWHFLTTYPPLLVNVVCEWSLRATEEKLRNKWSFRNPTWAKKEKSWEYFFFFKVDLLQLWICIFYHVLREHSHMTSDIFGAFLTYLPTYYYEGH